MGISSYRAADASALAAIYSTIYHERRRQAAGFHRRMRDLLAAGGTAWVLRQGNAITAFTAATPVPGLDGVWELQGFVDPKSQRQGLGSALLRHLISQLKRMGARQLSYCVTAPHGPAAAFLRKHDFFVEHEEQIMMLADLTHLPTPGLLLTDLQIYPRPAAIPTFCRLYSQSFAGLPWYQPYSPAEVEDALDDPADLLFLINEGQPIGFVWIRHSSPGQGEIEPIGVVQAYQGRGFGRALLLAGLGRLVERGVGQVKIGVWRSNEIAINLYEQFGFEPARMLTYLAYDLQ
jgi:ribosomal protein S18 acetylase RimI-like enzyme